jgi:hypothetical protein
MLSRRLSVLGAATLLSLTGGLPMAHVHQAVPAPDPAQVR